jgi:hypothetical protein
MVRQWLPRALAVRAVGAAAPVPSAAPAPAQRRSVNDLSDVPPSYRRTNPGTHERHRQRVSAHGEPDLRAAYGKVIAAIADRCVNCAARREGISEVMPVHQRAFTDV